MQLGAVRALGRVEHPAAADALAAAVKRSRAELRLPAAEALKEITGQELGTNPLVWRQWWREHKESFRPPGEPSKEQAQEPPAAGL